MAQTKLTKPAKIAVSKAQQVSDQLGSLEIKDVDSFKQGIVLLGQVKDRAGEVKDQKGKILDPLKESIKEVNSLFKPVEESLTDNEKSIKDQMVNFRELNEDQNKKKAQKLEARVERGTMKASTAIAKLGDLESIDGKYEVDDYYVQYKTVKTLKLPANPKTLPQKYWKTVVVVDTKALEKDLRDGVKVTGAKMVDSISIAAGKKK